MSLSKKASKNAYVLMFVKLDQPFFDAGQQITGCVCVDVVKPFPADKLKIKIGGAEKVFWIDTETIQHRVNDANGVLIRIDYEYIKHERKGKCKIFEIEQTLFDVNGTFLPGQYTFPFIVPTNHNFPGSFCIETPTDAPCELKKSIIEYGISAKLESSDDNIKNLKYKGEFIVRQNLPPTLLKTAPTQISFEVTKCFCCGKGNGALQAYMERNNYALNEEIMVKMMADNRNSSAAIDGLRVELMQSISLKNGKNSRDFRAAVGGDFQSIFIPSGQAMTEPVTMMIRASQNPYKYAAKNYSAETMCHATTHGKLVDCSYVVYMYPTYKGCCVSGGSINFKINLFSPEIALPQFIPMSGAWQPKSMPLITISGYNMSNTMVVMA